MQLTMSNRNQRRILSSFLLAISIHRASSFVIPPRKLFANINVCQCSSSSKLSLQIATQEIVPSNDQVNILQTYADLLQTHPLATKSITAAVLACSGDAIAQIRSSAYSYDIRRGAAFLIFGAAYTGAFQHYWFDYLAEHIAQWGEVLGVWGPDHVSLPVALVETDPAWWRYFDIVSQLENPPSPNALAVGKLVMNQFVMVPMIYMPLFFAFTGLISGLDFNQSFARAKSLYLPILRRNYFFWLPVQFIQFLAIPMDFQITFVSTASLVWTVILSTIGGGATTPASPSTIVAYATEEELGEEIVTLSRVDPGPANEITDDVMLEDVTSALIPDQLLNSVTEAAEVASGDVAVLTTGGLAAGLLASAADGAVVGEAVGTLIGVETSVGVATVATAGAGLGLLTAMMANDDDKTLEKISTEAIENKTREQ